MKTPDKNVISLSKFVYLKLLQLDGLWRIENQKVYCELRDFIARETGNHPEDVQNAFEQSAAIEKLNNK